MTRPIVFLLLASTFLTACTDMGSDAQDATNSSVLTSIQRARDAADKENHRQQKTGEEIQKLK